MVKGKIIIIVVFVVVWGLMSGAACGATYYIDPDGDDSDKGISWDTAFATIGKGIDISISGDEIWVAKGTYALTSEINLNKAVAIYGGFGGTETALSQRDWAGNLTVIDGNGSVRCFNVSADATIDGFTITGGNAGINNGGGIYIHNLSSPEIISCIIRDNEAQYGAGIYSGDSTPEIINCLLVENDSNSDGGGIYNNNSDAVIINCTLTRNYSNAKAGGIYNNSSDPYIVNTILWGNTDRYTNTNDLDEQIYDDASSTSTVTYSCIEDGGINDGSIPFGGAANHNTDFNPLLFGYTLHLNSPCIDVGDGSSVPDGISYGIYGDNRIADGDEDGSSIVDMGADEFVRNRPPVISDPNADVLKIAEVNNLLSITVSANDVDGDTIIYSANDLPQGAVFNESTHIFTWTPTSGQKGRHYVKFTASDGELEYVSPAIIDVNGTGYDPNDPCGLADSSSVLFINKYHPDANDDYTRAQAMDPNTPWASLWAVDGSVLQAGDTLYIRGGDYTVRSPSNDDYVKMYPQGTSSSRVTIASYPGEHVVLRGGTTIYEHFLMIAEPSTPGPDPCYVTLDSLDFIGHIDTSDGRLYVPMLVRFISANNIEVKNCRFYANQGSDDIGYGLRFDPEQFDREGWGHLLLFQYVNDIEVNNVEMGCADSADRMEIKKFGGDALLFDYCNTAAIKNSKFYDAGHDGIHIRNGSAYTIEDNEFCNRLHNCLDVSNMTNSVITRNKFYNWNTIPSGLGGTLTGHAIELLYSSNNQIYHNLIYGGDYGSAGIQIIGKKGSSYGDSNNNEIFNNLIYSCGWDGIQLIDKTVGNDNAIYGNKIYNNIIFDMKKVYDSTSAEIGLWFYDFNDNDSLYKNEFKNNIINGLNGDGTIRIYERKSSTTTFYSAAEFNNSFSLAVDNNDADPNLIDPVNGDFHLTSGSPCIDAGNPNTDSNDVGTSDYEGDDRFIDGDEDGNSIVDIGADEIDIGADEEDCFPSDHKDYDEWVSVGKPDCWCNPRQCYGDADGLKEGNNITGYAYISPKDLDVLIDGWMIKDPTKGTGIVGMTTIEGIPYACADFDHLKEGSNITGYARVSLKDMDIMIEYWLVKEPTKGDGVPADCLD